jgi:hypothetical protein
MQPSPQLIFIDGSVLQSDLPGFVLKENLQKRSESLQQQNKIMISNGGEFSNESASLHQSVSKRSSNAMYPTRVCPGRL